MGFSVVTAAGSNGSSGNGYGFLVVLALLGVAFYLFILRPQRSRMRKAHEQQRNIEVGARVMTVSGMYGTVAAIEDDAVLIEIAPGVMTRWARAAIGQVVAPEETLGLDSTPPAEREDPDG